MLSIQLAHAAVVEAGFPEMMEYIIPSDKWGITIKSPCPLPHVTVKAVALAHQAAGHAVVFDHVEGHAHFSCVECGME